MTAARIDAAAAARHRPRRRATPAGRTDRAAVGPVRIAFLGFGLISGSVARALRASPESAGWPLVAWSPSGAGPASAVADGVIDRAASDVPAAIEGADLVVLGGPATACLELLDGLAGPWSASLGA